MSTCAGTLVMNLLLLFVICVFYLRWKFYFAKVAVPCCVIICVTSWAELFCGKFRRNWIAYTWTISEPRNLPGVFQRNDVFLPVICLCDRLYPTTIWKHMKYYKLQKRVPIFKPLWCPAMTWTYAVIVKMIHELWIQP